MVIRGRILQYVVFCAGSFATLQSGLNDGWPSFALPQLQSNTSTIPLTNGEGSWVASIFPIGTIFGSLLLAVTLDKYGRKTMLLVGSLPFCATWLMIAFASSFWELLVARFLAGILEGTMFFCVSVYLAEIADPQIRGFLITGTKAAHIFGLLLSNILGAFLTITKVAIISSILSLGVMLCFLVPESPYFYMIKDDNVKAKQSMERFNENADFDSVRNALNEQKIKNGKWYELFTVASNRKSLCLVMVFKIFQQFSGFISFVYYAQTLFRQSKNDVDPIILVSAFYLLQMIVMIINGLIIDKVGRKPLLVASISTVVVALLIVSVYFTLNNMTEIKVSDYSWCPVFGLFLYIIGYTLGLRNISYLIISEVFPLHVKSSAIAIVNITFGISAAGVSKFFQYTKDEYGLHVPLLVFSISSICSIPFFIFCIPETKSKTLEEIEKTIRTNQTSDVN
ncbi:hypothetical protein FQR65_LT07554 [Abscondita terminalis]|nr:hypothetical protein FQR65_LT07554 [Abscondita terminalis]